MADKLKPCPFCGREPKYWGDSRRSIFCTCLASPGVDAPTAAKAAEIWNRRTALAQVPHAAVLKEPTDLDVNVIEHSTRVRDDPLKVTHWTVEVGEIGSEDEAQELASLVRAARAQAPTGVKEGEQ